MGVTKLQPLNTWILHTQLAAMKKDKMKEKQASKRKRRGEQRRNDMKEQFASIVKTKDAEIFWLRDMIEVCIFCYFQIIMWMCTLDLVWWSIFFYCTQEIECALEEKCAIVRNEAIKHIEWGESAALLEMQVMWVIRHVCMCVGWVGVCVWVWVRVGVCVSQWWA